MFERGPMRRKRRRRRRRRRKMKMGFGGRDIINVHELRRSHIIEEKVPLAFTRDF